MQDGRRLGNIIDMEFNLHEGRITAIVVPGTSRFLGLLREEDDIVIPWERIKRLETMSYWWMWKPGPQASD